MQNAKFGVFQVATDAKCGIFGLKMTERLRTKVEAYVEMNGKARLCAELEISLETLRRWMNNGVPTARKALRLAMAVGCQREEALALAREECPSESQARTA